MKRLTASFFVVLLLGLVSPVHAKLLAPGEQSLARFTVFDATLGADKGVLTLYRGGATLVISTQVATPVTVGKLPIISGSRVYEVENGIEWEIVLNAVPVVNSFSLNVNGAGLEWYYHPSLTVEYTEPGWTVNDTHAYDPLGELVAHRPIDIVGSYAVYSSEAKFMHVYRPRVVDSGGSETWGKLSYSENVLTVTVDREWLKKAVYPVYIDPTFGYKTQGGSFWNVPDDQIKFTRYTYAGGDQYAYSITAYLGSDETDTIQCAIYDNSLNLVNLTETWVKTGDGWHTFEFPIPFAIANGNYHLAVWSNSPDTHPAIAYDAGQDGFYDTTSSWQAWPDPLTKSITSADHKLSMYVLYGHAPAAPVNKGVDSDAVFSRDVPGWVNVTVNDANNVTNIDTVDIQVNTTLDTQNFTLRWTQATDIFNEVSDPDEICTLDTVNSTAINLNATAVRVCYHFTMTGGADGACDVRVTTTDDEANIDVDTYAAEFEFSFFNWDEEVSGMVDSAFSFFGILGFMDQAITFINSVGAHFTASLVNLAVLINLQFQVIWQVFFWWVDWATRIITAVLNFGVTLQEILNGVATGTVNIWTYFNFANIIDAVPIFLIIYWIDSMGKRARTQGSLQVLYGDLSAFANVFAYFMGAFSGVIGFIEGKISWLLNALT